jgi:hypothetical protein
MYIYIEFKLRKEETLSKKVICEIDLIKKIEDKYCGYIICIDELNILKNNDILRKTYETLINSKDTVLYKVTSGESNEKVEQLIKYNIPIKKMPCIIFMSNGELNKEPFQLNWASHSKFIEKIKAYIKYCERDILL